MRPTPTGLLPLICVVTILSGAISTLTMKAAYQTTVDGRRFSKPFFMESIVGVAMATSLAFVPCVKRKMTRRTSRLRHFAPLPLLAASDLIVGLLDVASVLYAPASIISITNCSILIFSAASTRIVLGTRYDWRQWAGIAIAAMGVGVVGIAALLHRAVELTTTSASAPAIGVLLSLGARALQAVQFAFEERFLKAQRWSPLLQSGGEGAIEMALCLAIVLPLANSLPGSDHGRLEDVAATLTMLRASPTLCALVTLSGLSLAALNPLSMLIGQQHGSVLRVFMDVGRPAIVWAASLVAYRCSGGAYGEPWQSPRAPIELGGFVTLGVGLALFCSQRAPASGAPAPPQPGCVTDEAVVMRAAGEERLLSVPSSSTSIAG